MPGRNRLETTSDSRLDHFYFTEVHHLKGQRPEASTLTIHWKEIKRESVGTAMDPAAENTKREKKTLSETVYKEQQHFHLCQHRC